MFIAALFTIARTWKQPRWMDKDGRWMDKEVVVYIHNGILLSYKKECIWVSSNEVDESRAILQSEVSQKEKDKYPTLIHIYGI